MITIKQGICTKCGHCSVACILDAVQVAVEERRGFFVPGAPDALIGALGDVLRDLLDSRLRRRGWFYG